MFPSPPSHAHPVTRFWQVERDGNPLRRFGHVSPFIGKLGPLDSDSLDQIGRLTRAALPPLPGSTLVIGMTESSLLLAFFVALWQQTPVDLRFTTRYVRQGATKRAFREPHSHGPQHYLALEDNARYAQIVIIEDELTTGATLRNLILAVADVTSRVFVVTLRDLRPQELRDELQSEMAKMGVELNVLSLETIAWEDKDEVAPLLPFFNPFGRQVQCRQNAFTALENQFARLQPDLLVVISECVDIALQFWLQLPPASRPELRQVTRSPWKIDGQHVLHAESFAGGENTSRYFLYNFEPSAHRRALWIGESFNAMVGEGVSAFFKANAIEAQGILIEDGVG